MEEVKKVYIKRDERNGWSYLCPWCMRHITPTHKMKECYHCGNSINTNQCVIYKGKVK